MICNVSSACTSPHKIVSSLHCADLVSDPFACMRAEAALAFQETHRRLFWSTARIAEPQILTNLCESLGLLSNKG